MVATVEDLRRRARLALITRAGRTTDVNPRARSVSVEKASWWSDRLGVPVAPGTPTAALPSSLQIDDVLSLSPEQRTGYLKLRAAGGTHARVMRDLRGLPARKTAGAKATKAPAKKAAGDPRVPAAREGSEQWNARFVAASSSDLPREQWREYASAPGQPTIAEWKSAAAQPAKATKAATPRVSAAERRAEAELRELRAEQSMSSNPGRLNGRIMAAEQRLEDARAARATPARKRTGSLAEGIQQAQETETRRELADRETARQETARQIEQRRAPAKKAGAAAKFKLGDKVEVHTGDDDLPGSAWDAATVSHVGDTGYQVRFPDGSLTWMRSEDVRPAKAAPAKKVPAKKSGGSIRDALREQGERDAQRDRADREARDRGLRESLSQSHTQEAGEERQRPARKAASPEVDHMGRPLGNIGPVPDGMDPDEWALRQATSRPKRAPAAKKATAPRVPVAERRRQQRVDAFDEAITEAEKNPGLSEVSGFTGGSAVDRLRRVRDQLAAGEIGDDLATGTLDSMWVFPRWQDDPEASRIMHRLTDRMRELQATGRLATPRRPAAERPQKATPAKATPPRVSAAERRAEAELRELRAEQQMSSTPIRFNSRIMAAEQKLEDARAAKAAAPAKAATPRKATGAAPSATTEVHVAALERMDSRDEAQRYLANIRGQELRDLARRYSAQGGVGGSTAQGMRDGIVDAAVGSRRNFAAILQGATLPYGPRPGEAGASPTTALSDYRRALDSGLSPRDASAYAAWVRDHPGGSIAAWQASRREREQGLVGGGRADEASVVRRERESLAAALRRNEQDYSGNLRAREVADYLATIAWTERGPEAETEARRYLAEDLSLTAQQWRELARDLHVRVPAGASIRAVRDAIYGVHVAGVLTARAIRRS